MIKKYLRIESSKEVLYKAKDLFSDKRCDKKWGQDHNDMKENSPKKQRSERSNVRSPIP